ncbi:MAG: energy transducer TonB [Pseudomonadota bacterium]
MAAEGTSGAGFDWRLDSPWRRLPWTLPGALLIGFAGLWGLAGFMAESPPPQPKPKPMDARLVEIPPPPPERKRVVKTRPPAPDEARTPPNKPPASLAAPPAPSAEEWQLASTYAPRNAKRYRNAWGQQVRSMMGTAVEGPDQGQVRFRIEIAPDGRIAKVEELWSTSAKASELAWKAIRNFPATPPTPNGKPLIFEQTISFLPHETGWPPSYQLDCLPEPEPFTNPWAWNGTSPPPDPEPRKHRPPPPEGCPPDSTAATIEEEEQSMKRQMDQWRWAR